MVHQAFAQEPRFWIMKGAAVFRELDQGLFASPIQCALPMFSERSHSPMSEQAWPASTPAQIIGIHHGRPFQIYPEASVSP